jgi:hypothetical protein
MWRYREGMETAVRVPARRTIAVQREVLANSTDTGKAQTKHKINRLQSREDKKRI